MPKLLILRGYSGSGKSTIAKQWVSDDPDNRVRSNRDDLRASLFNSEGVLSHSKEEFITRIQRETVKSALTEGKDVVLDDTNLNPKLANYWVTFVHNLGFDWEVIDINVPASVCILRDAARGRNGGRSVGTDVILRQEQKYPYPWPTLKPKSAQSSLLGLVEPYVEQPGLPWVIIVDLDGTLALNRGGRGWFEWMRVGEDEPNEYVIDLVQILRDEESDLIDHVIFLSGRDAVCRDITLTWLDKYVGFWENQDELFMRNQKDNRSDDIVKYELFNNHIRGKYNVRFVIDDRPKVCRLWRSMDLPLLQVGTGEEF